MLQAAPTVAVYREPFKLGSPHVMPVRAGASLVDIVRDMAVLPPDFMLRGVIHINGHLVPFEHWSRVRPKPDRAVVTFHVPVQGGGGGGGGGGKQILAIVAALAITVLTAGIGAGMLATAGGWFAAGSMSATILAAGVSLAGALLANALITPPTQRANSQDRDDGKGGGSVEPASVSGNLLEPNAPIPRVIGTRRIFPPFASEPTTEFVGQDEIVHAVAILAGPHEIDEVRLGDVAIDPNVSDVDVQVQTYDGFPDSERPDYPQRYSRTFPVQLEMSVHGTEPEDMSLSAPPLPVWHGTVCADDPDEVWLHFVLGGLLRQDDLDDVLMIPLRIRMKLRGTSTWRYLPELHIANCTQSQIRMQIKLFFGQTFTSTPPTPLTDRGWISARKFVPAQNVSPVGTDWDADAYFSSGAGDDVYEASTVASTKVINTTLTPDLAAFYLDHADWPRGIYDIEVIRGATFRQTSFTSSTYVYSGDVLDFYGSRDSATLPLSRQGLLDRLSFLRAVSVKNLPPINEKNLAMVYVRARNRTVGNLSVRASGYVRDWDGTDWIEWKTTSNPAPHFRDILTGTLNFDPMPETMLDDAALLEWRQVCIDEDYRCDLIVESGTLAEVLRIVASCGFARPYQSEIWGVIRDYDRSGEAPVQLFTARNSSGFSWSKAFPRLPTGLRVNYRDDNYEYAGKQLMIYRRGINEIDSRTEQITYDGLVRRADIIRRARYDLLQGELRSAIYSLTAPVESIVCRRGSLVAVINDTVQKYYSYARIVDVLRNTDGDVEGVILDSTVQVHNTADLLSIDDMLSTPDLLNVGLVSAVTVRYADGSVNVHSLHSSTVTGETDQLMFSAPINTANIKPGNLIGIGLLGREYKRMLVNEITPAANLTARLTLVDEAPEIWTEVIYNG